MALSTRCEARAPSMVPRFTGRHLSRLAHSTASARGTAVSTPCDELDISQLKNPGDCALSYRSTGVLLGLTWSSEKVPCRTHRRNIILSTCSLASRLAALHRWPEHVMRRGALVSCVGISSAVTSGL